jgi:uncharacterized protein (TIGR03435 family)
MIHPIVHRGHRLHSLVWIACILLVAISAVTNQSLAQAPPVDSPSFEVASIHPAPTCTSGFSMSPPGSRYFSVTNVSMAFLIAMAYKVSDDQIERNPGWPAWIESECYTISARAAGDGSLGNDQLRLLLLNLLAQRFHLTLHNEVKDFSGYALVVAKDGAKLVVTKGGATSARIGPDGLHAHNFSMASLASMFPRVVGAHVVDQTGLTGRYDIDLSFEPNSSLAATDSSLQSVFTALPEQLGLKLVAQKVPATMLVIDHIEKVPTEN